MPAAVGLTARELVVLRELVSGVSDKEIAARLGMACSTVRTHVSRLRVKFAAGSRSQLIAQAVRVRAVAA